MGELEDTIMEITSSEQQANGKKKKKATYKIYGKTYCMPTFQKEKRKKREVNMHLNKL